FTSYGLCSASKMMPSYGAADSATALSTVGGENTLTGTLPFSSARMSVFRRGVAAICCLLVTGGERRQLRSVGRRLVAAPDDVQIGPQQNEIEAVDVARRRLV